MLVLVACEEIRLRYSLCMCGGDQSYLEANWTCVYGLRQGPAPDTRYAVLQAGSEQAGVRVLDGGEGYFFRMQYFTQSVNKPPSPSLMEGYFFRH